jgi:hypothetical protein
MHKLETLSFNLKHYTTRENLFPALTRTFKFTHFIRILIKQRSSSPFQQVDTSEPGYGLNPNFDIFLRYKILTQRNRQKFFGANLNDLKIFYRAQVTMMPTRRFLVGTYSLELIICDAKKCIEMK